MFQGQYGFANAGGQQQGGQPNQQQMMYNQQQQLQQQQQQQQQQPQQQFAGMPQGGFPQGANPQMMHAQQGMMANMAQNGQMGGHPQQFAGAFAQGMQGQQGFNPNNYMMAGGAMQGFPAGMTPQQAQMMQQRMHQQQQMQLQMQLQQQHQQQHQQQQHQHQHQQQQQHTQQQQQPNAQQQSHQQMQHMQHQQGSAPIGQSATPQRPPSSAQGTPNPMQMQQPQFPTSGPPSQTQTPTGHPQQQQQPQQPGAVATPQTPSFPNQPGMTAPAAPPMTPETQAREKERFALLLDINHELLYESILLQTTQQELKKEKAAATNGATDDKKPSDEETLFQQDYLQCMRRLQANLSYMAALADRKPEVKGPPCPAYLSAPALNLTLKPRAQPMTAEGSDAQADPATDRTERDKSIKDLYRRLQAVFPGFDPKKEPAFRVPAGGKPGNPAAGQPSPVAQQTPQMPNTPMPPGVAAGMGAQ